MEKLFKREQDLISEPIRQFLFNELSKGLDNQGREITKVDTVSIYEVLINEDDSELRSFISVSAVNASSRVWVKFHEDGTTNNTLNLSINKEFKLIFDNETKQYLLTEDNDISIMLN